MDTTSVGSTTFSARSPLTRLIRRSWVLLLLGAVAFALVGTGWAVTRPVRWTSTVTLLVNPVIGTPFNGQTGRAADNSLQTERAVVLGEPVLLTAAAKAGAPLTSARLRAGLDVQVPPSTQVLSIAFAGTDPEQARRGAQAVAEAYLTERERTATKAIADRVAAIKAEQAVNSAAILDQTRRIAALGGKDQAAARALQAELTSLTDQSTELLRESAQLRSTPVEPGIVLRPAGPAGAVQRWYDVAVIAALALAGAMLGLAVAGWRRSRDRLVRDVADVDDLVLTEVEAERAEPLEPVTATSIGGLAESGYRRLRIAVTSAAPTPGVVVLAAVGPASAAAAATANLAVSASNGGLRVIVVDSALRQGAHSAAALLRTESGPGLHEALTGRGRAVELARTSEFGPRVLGSGQGAEQGWVAGLPADPAALIGGLRRQFDLTLVTVAEPQGPVTRALATAADAVLLVVTRDASERAAVPQARRALEDAGARVLGCVLLARELGEPQAALDPAARARHRTGRTDGEPDQPGVPAPGATGPGRADPKHDPGLPVGT